MTTPVIEDDLRDAFGNLISNRTNVLDIAAHYPYSPERWRLFVDGSRVFPEYGSVAQYNHAGDYHELQPAAGETVTFESAERPRYVVQYEFAATWAYQTNQSLASGDSIRVGLYDGSNGWYMEHSGDQADDVADFVLERDGSEVYRESDIGIELPVTSFGRLSLQSGWYDVTRQIWERSFPEDGVQKNPQIGKFSADNARGSKTGNLPLHFSVTASSSTTNLVLEAGSAAQVNLGETTTLTRNKVDTVTANVDTTGTWVPLIAIRVDPDRDITNVQLTDVSIGEFDTSADIELIAQSFAPENVADSNGDQLTDADFSTPALFNPQNNVIELSTAVEQVVNNDGTLTTSTDDPGGFQVGSAALFTGAGNTVTGTVPGDFTSKRPVYGRDIVVFMANAGGTADVTWQYRTEQNW